MIWDYHRSLFAIAQIPLCSCLLERLDLSAGCEKIFSQDTQNTAVP